MNEQTKNIYSEVYSILNLLDEEYKNKLPTEILNMIEQQKNSEYSPVYSLAESVENQNIQKETKAMIALFKLYYWCDSNEEQEQLVNLLKGNEDKVQAELRERYDIEKVFKKKQEYQNINKNEVSNNTAMIMDKKTIFSKIINKIKEFFRRFK